MRHTRLHFDKSDEPPFPFNALHYKIDVAMSAAKSPVEHAPSALDEESFGDPFALLAENLLRMWHGVESGPIELKGGIVLFHAKPESDS